MPSAVIIGCGRMGREHAEAYREMGVQITDVYDIDYDKMLAFAQEFNVPRTWNDQPHVLKIGKDAYVSVCSWDDVHSFQIMRALEDGNTVIAEKPLCLTFEDLQKIAAMKTGKLVCNLPLRHQVMPAIQKPYHIEADYLWGRADRLDGWRKNCEGYSFVLGGGVHVADAIIRVMGARPIFVTAVAQTLAHFPAPTMVSVIGEFDDGRSFSMEINCAYTGTHEWRVCQWGPYGKSEIVGMSSDKRACIREAVSFPNRAADAGIAAHALCFAIERSIKNKLVEQVIYP